MLEWADDKIIDGVLAEFEQLAKIPRQSGHEKAVSDYLVNAFKNFGCQVQQDAVYNVIADLPASPGYEQKPVIILQGHMDMVCVAAPGVEYDPLTDPIKLIRDEKFLSADGTSLGADDGIGVAEALFIMKNIKDKDHGPLRAIITVDEEQGMSGAINLDPKFLTDAAYLINCDSENYDELTVGSAGSVNIDFNKKVKFVKPQGRNAYKISINGLKGGHSGMEINKGRANAIRLMAMLLYSLNKAGIEYELASIAGGKARNSIPAEAHVLITTNGNGADILRIIDLADKQCVDVYDNTDKDISFDFVRADLPAQVMTEEGRDSIINLLVSLHSGVYAMSHVLPKLVETSANLGMISQTEDLINIKCLPRSSVDSKLDDFAAQADILAGLTGFTADIDKKTPGWKERQDSKLAKIMQEVFRAQNGKTMKVESIHAGLECGWHLLKNHNLDVVSIGVSTYDIHSPKERLELWTIVPQVKLIVETLKRLYN